MQFIFKRPLAASALLIVFLILARWIAGGGTFSYFIVAGDLFVDTAETPAPIHTETGPGYDGQFFYRFALNPFNVEPDQYGVQLDHPAYRHQRIVYPLLVWLLSGTQPGWVPFMLVLVNALAFMVIIMVLLRLCRALHLPSSYALFPLVFSGLWMSLGRDLAEPVEGMFLVSAFYFLYRRALMAFIVCATLSIFTREPSAIILLPVAVSWWYRGWQMREFRLDWQLAGKGILLALPFALLLVWKLALKHWHNSETLMEGGNSIGIPFVGLYQGLRENLRKPDSWRSVAESGLWLAFVCWNLWLLFISRKALTFRKEYFFRSALSAGWIASVVMASTYTYSIFMDDWAFLRVLSGFQLLSAVLVMTAQTRIPRSFLLFSILLLATTWARLILRI